MDSRINFAANSPIQLTKTLILTQIVCFAAMASGLIPLPSLLADDPQTQTLFSFDDDQQRDQIQANGVTIEHLRDGKLRVHSKANVDWPGVTLKPKAESWNGEHFQHLAMDVTNTGKVSFEIGLRIDNPGGDGYWKSNTIMTHVLPGETKHIQNMLTGAPWKFDRPLNLVGMHRSPGQQTIDPTDISQLIIFLRMPKQEHDFTLDNIQFETRLTEMKADAFLPFIDEFGQFIHMDWPGKTHSLEDLKNLQTSESKQIAAQPAPPSFNGYGGWKDDSTRKPSRLFSTAKIDGKWWLIDPSGSLFWSHGIDSVADKFGSTPVEHREMYFRNLPKQSPFLHPSTWGMGFYGDKIPFQSFNFYAANLSKKYGENWKKEYAAHAHKRLRHWGMNTMACWSDPQVIQQGRTPYTAFFRCSDCPVLAGSEKRWTQFADVFDERFEQAAQKGFESCRYAVGDPYCIGFFVDNELHWGNETALAEWTLKSPPQQAAKKTFVAQLKQKYGTIELLNQSWATNHSDWEALLQSTTPPKLEKAQEDLKAFTKAFCEKYFSTIDGILERNAPGQMYLGCRFFWKNETAIRTACKYCDVVSFNWYSYTADSLRLPEGEDKPVLIGEFHFGALDRGLFHPTRIPTGNQEDRARAYRLFLETALTNPLIVGTHWFQYTSEPTTGRGDGENYQVGFVDICDTPYVETVQAAQTIANRMYEMRSNHIVDVTQK